MNHASESIPYPLVAVAITNDKSSQNALRWAFHEKLVLKGQSICLIHVNTHAPASLQNDGAANGYKKPSDSLMKDVFLPFRCFCTRKEVNIILKDREVQLVIIQTPRGGPVTCNDIVLEDTDVARALVEFVSQAAIEKLVIGAPSKGGFIRLKGSDVPTHVSKGAPDFCSVFVVSKEKLLSERKAVRPAPVVSPLRAQMHNQASFKSDVDKNHAFVTKGEMTPRARISHDESIKSPFLRGNRGKSYADLSPYDTDISFVSSGRPSIDRALQGPRHSGTSDGVNHSTESVRTPIHSVDSHSVGNEFSSISGVSTSTSWSSHTMDDVEAEVRRLKLELKQTMDMYNAACKEAVASKKQVLDLHRWKVEEEQKLEEARHAEESAIALAEREKEKCRAAMEAAEAQHRIAELEAQKRRRAEMQVYKEAAFASGDTFKPTVSCRRYKIDEIEVATNYFADNLRIGEGGYGPVYKCFLDHTCVAVKVLRPDAAQGRTQFQQEVEVLSCIRHPNMVLLLGACPEYGCLVYEYMSNGSLDDRLFRRGGTPPIPWQHRFRIAAEIATGLLFLHQTKPEPLVHRDLKPGNILLDRNYVSKISDVGLARLVPPSVADTVTQYRMTSTAGTFCYIDPEYQQTGMLGVKSDIYSLGIMLLQIITARPPMGLTHHVARALDKGNFDQMLDPVLPDWPVHEAAKFAQLALSCSELRRKDRPDLATVVLPELSRLRLFAEADLARTAHGSPNNGSQVSMMDLMSDPLMNPSMYDYYDSSPPPGSATGRRSNDSWPKTHTSS